MKTKRQKLAIKTARQNSISAKPKKTLIFPRSAKQDGEKKCIIRGEFFPKSEMIRFMIDEDRNLVPDILGKLQGHGIWVYADKQALGQAIALKRPFRKAVHKDMIFINGTAELVESLLIKRCQDLLGLACKSSMVFCGFTKCKQAIEEYKKGILLCPKNASTEQMKKLGLEKTEFDVKLCQNFTKEELACALGKDDLTFVFVRGASETDKLCMELKRFSLYSGDSSTFMDNEASEKEQNSENNK